MKFVQRIDQYLLSKRNYMSSNDLVSSLAAVDDVIATLDTASFTYENVALGLLLTEDKQYFRVPQGADNDIAFIYYRNDAGVPVPVATLAGGEVISGLKAQIQNLWAQAGRSTQQINLFDPDNTRDGLYIDTVGATGANASFFCSAQIPVLPETTYVFGKAVGQLAFYDFNGSFISYLPGVKGDTPFTTPAKTFSLMFSQTISTGKYSQMLLRGNESPSAFISFGARDTASQDNRTHYQVMSTLKHMQPVGVNLFDQSRIIKGYALSTDGSLTPNGSYFVSDYIPVLPRTLYVANKASSVTVFYNADYEKMALSKIVSNTPFLVPEGAVYFRFQQSPLLNADTLMVIAGESLPSSYIPFGYPTSQDLYETSIINARKAVEQTQPSGRNIFDNSRSREGYSISYVNGAISKIANFFITGLLPVTPGDYFVSSYGTNSLCWYDVTGRFLSGSNAFSGFGSKPIKVPDNAWYVQFQGSPVSRAASLMVTQGDSIPAGYQPFGGSMESLPWQNKKVIWLGDSMTYNKLYQPYILAGTGMKQLANYSVPGQGVRTMADSLTGGNIDEADFISVFGGTNDYGGNRPLGNLADARPDYNESAAKSFYYDVFYVLNKIYTLKPTVRVVFSTPLMRGATGGQAYTYPAANGAGHHLEDYAQAIKDVCALFATPVCDLLKTSGINAYNLSTYTGDNLHPNATGSAIHARAMIAVFNAS
jgi:lysophospholipase L1-like esterase